MFYTLTHFEYNVEIEINKNDIRKVIELGKGKKSVTSATTSAIMVFCEVLRLINLL